MEFKVNGSSIQRKGYWSEVGSRREEEGGSRRDRRKESWGPEGSRMEEGKDWNVNSQESEWRRVDGGRRGIVRHSDYRRSPSYEYRKSTPPERRHRDQRRISSNRKNRRSPLEERYGVHIMDTI